MSARRRTAERLRRLIETEGDAVFETTSRFNDGRYDVTADFEGYQELRTEARSIKEDAIERLPELIETVQASVEANGGSVHLATDPTEANEYVEAVCAGHDADTVVKSKSMTTEEIDLNEHLEAAGLAVYETDLGEFVLQVAEERPSHIVGPAIHKSQPEIAALFNDVFEPDEPFETAEELTRFARDYLGARIREADVGITGANFVLAESGSIVLVTNEGNARKSAVTPDVHVAVAGIEKLIPSVQELGPFVDLIAKAATGQEIAQYVTVLSPPTDSPSLDFGADDSMADGDDREFHLVLLDNGRRDLRDDDDLRETLYCIRCGACSNSCANFQHVGGHAFGGETYSGGIATGWEAGVEGLDATAAFNDLCTGCSRCVDACPVKIDIPWINTVVRDRLNRSDQGTLDFLVDGLTPDEEPGGIPLPKRVFGNFGTLAKLGSATAPVSNWLATAAPVRALLDHVVGIDRRRDLPEFERETLRAWYERRGPRVSDPGREVVLYPDVYTNHVKVSRGRAAVRVLEGLGCRVSIPQVPESGRAPLSQGMVATARERARAVTDALGPHLDAGRDVVVIEPSDVAMFRGEYDKLLQSPAAERLRENSYEVMEFAYGLLEHGANPGVLEQGRGQELAYHSHCQQRTLGLEVYTEAVFDRLDYEVETSTVECCGMAGSFGYKSEYYDLSMDVGEPLGDAFADATRVAASGTSCLEQLAGLLDVEPVHPIEVVDPWSGQR